LSSTAAAERLLVLVSTTASPPTAMPTSTPASARAPVRAVSSQKYDCTVLRPHAEEQWPEEQRRWCCRHKTVGCPKEQQQDSHGQQKKQRELPNGTWVAPGSSRSTAGLGIVLKQYQEPVESKQTASEMFDCSAGHFSSWPSPKKDWCCRERRGLGACPEEERRLLARLEEGHRELLHPLTHPSRCLVAVVGGSKDTVVPRTEVHALSELIRGAPHAFELRDEQFDGAVCGDATHHVWSAARPEDYRARLCNFWSAVFARPAADCGLNALPGFTEEVGAEPGWKQAPSWPLFG